MQNIERIQRRATFEFRDDRNIMVLLLFDVLGQVQDGLAGIFLESGTLPTTNHQPLVLVLLASCCFESGCGQRVFELLLSDNVFFLDIISKVTIIIYNFHFSQQIVTLFFVKDIRVHP
jgi:hypothetical protein